MVVFVLKRLGLAVVTIVVVSVIAFLLVHAGTTTPGVIALGMGATPAEIAAYNQKIGWNDPLALQYLAWLGKAVHGDLGVSLTDGRSILNDILTRLPVTGALATGATIVSTVLGVALGVTAAVRRGLADRVVSAFTGIVVAIPAFWLGIVLIFLLAVQTPLLPATGFVPFEISPSGWAASLVLPVLTLGIGGAAFVGRQTRASMIDALSQEHIRTLRATGTPTWRILYVHALRYASLPIVASVALQFIALFGGSVIIETLFAMPGLGLDIQGAVGSSDSPVVQGLVVIATIVVVIVNLVLELVSGILDPKLRTS
ncbi:ABC transporter permease [Galbitalea soli]|uniref:ABC transporter permease n=1 Tax=Galbitalea soli TaxID=1268042 RepID=A0A7C9PPD1_9MICO|nr:ABC transporter permease [Galbitalea soli]NEM92272.1 ABC transporter permease [Galbitalea soli]NYJ31772.1 peptide/nickel transport system permease protein [Galbitalea soli]